MGATRIPDNQAHFSVDEVIAATHAKHTGGSAEITHVSVDSRRVGPGGLYVALRGEQHDGHAFVDAAIAAGAAAVLVDHEVDVPARVARLVVDDTLTALGALARCHRDRMTARIVAVTGSVGKTTTKELLRAAFEGAGFATLATVGNLNNRIGVPMTLFTLESRHEIAVIELGMNQPGEIADLAAMCAPTVGLVTRVAAVHTGGVGDLAGVAREKGAIYAALGDDGWAIHRAEDRSLDIYVEASAARRRSFGSVDGADVRSVSHAVDERGTRAVIAVRDTQHDVSLRLLGRAASENACAVLAAVDALAPDRLEGAIAGTATVAPAPHRMEPFAHPSGILILDDAYNASPTSVEAALETAKELATKRGGRVVAVLADMLELGGDETALHERVGRAVIGSGARGFVACGERMVYAGRAALSTTMDGPSALRTRVVLLRSPADAASCVRELAQPNDVVLVKGSQSMGMEAVAATLRGPLTLGPNREEEE